MQGYKVLFRDKHKAQSGWICAVLYGDTKPITMGVAIYLPPISITTTNIASPDSVYTTQVDHTQKYHYNPNHANHTYSPQFHSFIQSNIISELNNIIERDTHWIGWMYINSFSDIARVLWIYQHQTKTVS